MGSSSIPFNLQYYVERDRNNTYEWLVFVFTVVTFALHGILFHWLPRYFRSKRDENGLRARKYFRFLKYWDLWTSCIALKLPFKKETVYFQPSLVLLGIIYAVISAVLCIVQTADLNYQPQQYIICKRISRVAVGNLPMIMILLMKHDLVTSITGLQHDRLIFVHKWLSRSMWVLITAHLILAMKYWLDLNFEIMIIIPPQIFGMISYGCLVFLTWASNKWMRKWAYDFFLVQHRVFAFIMLLLAFFHNPANRAAVLISVHLLVIDRVLMKVLGFVHRRFSPTKGLCDFEICDEETIKVTIPIKKTKFAERTWYTKILPKFSSWNAGQHLYLNVGKVSLFQYHPFTINNLEEDGKMKLVIRKQKGFTKKLYDKLAKMRDEKMADEIIETSKSSDSTSSSDAYVMKTYSTNITEEYRTEGSSNSTFDEENNLSVEQPKNILQLKASFIGPFGAKHQPLLSFDTSLFIGAGSGGSFVLPVALKLLQEIKQRDESGDYLFRPMDQLVHLVWVIREINNEKWFDHIFDSLEEFIREGRVKVSLYITKEEPRKIEEPIEEKSSRLKGNIDSFEIRTSTLSEVRPEIERFYGRPDLKELIETHASSLSDPTQTKALAVCSCGPESLTNSVKVECQRNRWAKNAPDIYCYSESF